MLVFKGLVIFGRMKYKIMNCLPFKIYSASIYLRIFMTFSWERVI